MYPNISDVELVDRARAGSQEAYRELLRRFERPVFSLVLRMVRDRELAEDLAQETFVKAFRRLNTYDRQRKFSSWLFKIAHNATIDHLRRARLATVPLEGAHGEDDGVDLARTLADESAADPEAAASRGDLAAALEEAVGRLRPEYREIVLLRFREGLAYQEIAEVLDLPMGTVKTHLHRARKEMATSLRELGWGPEDVS